MASCRSSWRVRVGAGHRQRFDHRGVAVLAGDEQRGVAADARGRLQVRAGIEQPLASSTSPFWAAQCSAVMPSACVVLTSAPSWAGAQRRGCRSRRCERGRTGAPRGSASGSARPSRRLKDQSSAFFACLLQTCGWTRVRPGRHAGRLRLPLLSFASVATTGFVFRSKTAAVAETLEIGPSQRVQCAEHRVGHRRAIEP